MADKIKRTDHSLMNASHLKEEGLALAADALRSGRFNDLPDFIRHHLESCQECRMAVMELHAATRSEHGEWNEPPPFFSNRKQQNAHRRRSVTMFWFKVAAAILVLLLAGWVLLNKVWMSDSSPTLVDQTENTENLQPRDAFAPDPMMESLMELRFRGQAIQVTSPLKQDVNKAGKPISFNWNQEIPEPLQFTLQNNAGRIIARMQVYTNQLQMQSLTAGRYYWKLERKTELLYLGSFVVMPS